MFNCIADCDKTDTGAEDNCGPGGIAFCSGVAGAEDESSDDAAEESDDDCDKSNKEDEG